MFAFTTAFALLAFAATAVRGETHTVTFDNRCGRGTPTLIGQGGAVLSTGGMSFLLYHLYIMLNKAHSGAYTINGPLIGAIAYLQTGSCGFNGEGCTLLETTLRNPPSPGAGSSTDLSLIAPHSFSVTTGFGYYNGCDGAGADCTGPNCNTAFHVSTDTFVQVACQANNVNLAITFCD
ncbi:glycopeptide [Roridomyces roridus]|uniref:Glycopeptide n=1 Tax=Roridomyces roridus TaxID=1738132 RepID=A0AAD7BQS9_9AGAR|nr:glycopeptide [Roridomyces roridus]